jgi:hypothetical protein
VRAATDPSETPCDAIFHRPSSGMFLRQPSLSHVSSRLQAGMVSA